MECDTGNVSLRSLFVVECVFNQLETKRSIIVKTNTKRAGQLAINDLDAFEFNIDFIYIFTQMI